MSEVFVAADNIFSPLGKTTAQNFTRLKEGETGIKQHHDTAIADEPFFASIFPHGQFPDNGYTKFEQLLIASVTDALSGCAVKPNDPQTVLVISTTKGNISLLETEAPGGGLNQRIALPTSAKLIAKHFGFVNQPVIVSNACISGVMAMLTAARLIRSGRYQNAVVAGADVLSKFIFSGFQAFQAVSAQPCKPFDINRNGITLGEGAATVILSANKTYAHAPKLLSGAISNDANHISAPSRTGQELAYAIEKTLSDSNLAASDIGMISAHGTATSYNDEMEAKALTLASLQQTPVNSLKGFYGHTLGAAGLIESVISVRSLKENVMLPTPGYTTNGVSNPLNICTSLLFREMKYALKTASGFGGCNASILFEK